MNKKIFSVIIAILLVATLCVAFVACTDTEEKGPIVLHAIPEGMPVNIELYLGEELVGTITKSTLSKVDQEKVLHTREFTMGDGSKGTTVTTFLSYSFESLLREAGASSVVDATKVFVTDKGEKPYDSTYNDTDLSLAYLTIGSFDEDGIFEAVEAKDNITRFLISKDSKSGKDIFKGAEKMTFTLPVVVLQAIPEGMPVNIELYLGEELVGTITKSTLSKVDQEKVSHTRVSTMDDGSKVTTVTTFLSYSFESLLRAAGASSVVDATKVFVTDKGEKPYDRTYNDTDLSLAYLTIGSFDEDGIFEAVEAEDNITRFLISKDSKSGKDIFKGAEKMTFSLPVVLQAIPEGMPVNIELYLGEELVGTITKSTLSKVDQVKVLHTREFTMDDGSKGTTVTTFLSYSFESLLREAGASSVVDATKVFVTEKGEDAYARTYNDTDLSLAYLTIGSFDEDGIFEAVEAEDNITRFLISKDLKSGKDIFKGAEKMTFTLPVVA